jgi:mRNA-degrading endonuclease RelE of RelBE toxin-antitoxin system
MVACCEGLRTALHGRSRRNACHRRGRHPVAENPYPPEAFHRGDYHRLRVGLYRVVYIVEDDLITVERVDRVTET